MKLFRLADGSYVQTADEAFGCGATAKVYKSLDNATAVKIYMNNSKNKRETLELVLGKYNALNTLSDTASKYWSKHLAWPTGIVVEPTLGVTMPFTPLPYSLTNLISRKWRKHNLHQEKRGTWKAHLYICLQLAGALKVYHNNGLCHSDLSTNNCLVDPVSGNMVMIDLDGLVIEGCIPPLVLGTPSFQAPEIVLGKVKPSIQTDKHSLAVMIYKTLMFHDPFNGRRIFPGAMVDEELRITYGSDPIYVQHPSDKRNRPEAPFLPVNRIGPHLPPLFEQAFISGLTKPDIRPQASEWEMALLKTLDRVITCANPDCEEKCFILTDNFSAQCPFCKSNALKGLRIPLLKMYRNTSFMGAFREDNNDNGQYIIAIIPDKKLHHWNIRPGFFPADAPNNNPLVTFEHQAAINSWKIHNLELDFLQIITDSGRQYIKKGQKATLLEGSWLRFGLIPYERIAHVEFCTLQ